MSENFFHLLPLLLFMLIQLIDQTNTHTNHMRPNKNRKQKNRNFLLAAFLFTFRCGWMVGWTFVNRIVSILAIIIIILWWRKWIVTECLNNILTNTIDTWMFIDVRMMGGGWWESKKVWISYLLSRHKVCSSSSY